jgi:predicted ATPase/class 3 adenylate cyclase
VSNAPQSVAADSSAELPRGTVTFVFTDIEGSTLRWERAPAAMSDAVRRHDAIVRAAITAHAGHVFKSLGDAFCAAFARAHDAVEAALTLQRELLAQDFQAVDGLEVRVAIHTGTADERDNDYFGPSLNRVARLLAVSHGGQIVLSGIAAELARGSLAADVGLRDLGEHRLKDIAATEHVFQLVAPNLRIDFPALRSIGFEPTNLPPEHSTFIGREAELTALGELVTAERIVTIVGSGGVGKTRSVIRLGHRFLRHFADGVWFIDLAELRDPKLVPLEIASVLAIRETGAGQLEAAVLAGIGGKRMLLVFDNCEHVIEEAAAMAQTLLARCPNVKILATSREALRINGEFVFSLLPLPERDAIALFLERGSAVDRHLRLTDDNAPIIADICRRLDGVPFALELAAAKLRVLSPRQIAERLRERFRLLKTDRRDSVPRQQTLRALIDWSYNLLASEEQRLLRRLAIFTGEFSLEAAVAIGAGELIAEPSDDLETLELLSSLVAKSLLVADVTARAETRYRLLESLREYAAERLAQSAELTATSENHAQYVLRFVRRAAAALPSAIESQWLDTIAEELANIRAALTWFFGAGNAPQAGAEIVASIGFFWYSRRFDEGARWLSAARVRIAELDARLAATVLLESVRNEPVSDQALELAQRSLEHARRLDDPVVLSKALEFLGQTLINANGYAEAKVHLEESIAQARRTGDSAVPGRPTTLLGVALLGIAQVTGGDCTAAITSLYEGLTISRRAKRDRDAAIALQALSCAALAEGRAPDAAVLAREAVDVAESLGDVRAIGIERCQLAHALLENNALAEARAQAIEAARLLRDAHAPHFFTNAVGLLCAIFVRLNDIVRAARLHGYVDTRYATLAFPPGPFLSQVFAEASAQLQQRLSRSEYVRLTAQGARFNEDQAIAEAREVASATGEKGCA